MTFRSLAIDTVFEFDSFGFPGLARGPWRKISARCYIRIADGMRCQVGSVYVPVMEVAQ